jgi:hypothetical protein
VRHTVRYAASLWLAIVMLTGVALAADDPIVGTWLSDPFVGKWSFDRDHSKFESGDVPQSMMITMEAAEGGKIRYHSESTFDNGRQTVSEYTADYDGHLAIVAGHGGVTLPVALKRVDANTVVATYKRSFKVVAISRRVVSPDGLTMTITTTEKQAVASGAKSEDTLEEKEEKTITNVSIFHRLK